MADTHDVPEAHHIRVSLHRQNQVMGGEREPVMLLILTCAAFGLMALLSMSAVPLLVTVFLFLVGIPVLQKMAKRDPHMRRVAQRSLKYTKHFDARSSHFF